MVSLRLRSLKRFFKLRTVCCCSICVVGCQVWARVCVWSEFGKRRRRNKLHEFVMLLPPLLIPACIISTLYPPPRQTIKSNHLGQLHWLRHLKMKPQFGYKNKLTALLIRNFVSTKQVAHIFVPTIQTFLSQQFTFFYSNNSSRNNFHPSIVLRMAGNKADYETLDNNLSTFECVHISYWQDLNRGGLVRWANPPTYTKFWDNWSPRSLKIWNHFIHPFYCTCSPTKVWVR